MSEFPAYDSCVIVDFDDHELPTIVHRSPTEIVCWHSPLNDGAISCSICESGVKVWLE